MFTIKNALDKSSEFLQRKEIETSRLDAELLLAHTLKTDRMQLYMQFDKPLTEEEKSSYRELIVRRGQHEPVAYLCGKREFMSLDFHVTPDVLIPRPETEWLVEHALHVIADMPKDRPLNVFEIGTGSGAIAVSVKHYCKTELNFTASDISPGALKVAKENAKYLGGDAIEFIEADLFGDRMGPFDLVLSNPPYVATTDRKIMAPDVTDYEPEQALFAGPKGMNIIDRIINEAAKRVRQNGALIFEIGYNQSEIIEKLIAGNSEWQLKEIVKDLQQIPRIVHLERC